MTANHNEKTGIAYGTIYGNTVPEIDQDIFENGTDLTFEAAKTEFASNLRNAIARAIDDGEDIETLVADITAIKEDLSAEDTPLGKRLLSELKGVLKDYFTGRRLKDLDHHDLEIADLVEAINGGATWETVELDSIIDTLENQGLWDNYEVDEPCHEYEYDTPHGKVKLYRTHLGGAALIYVNESPYVAYVRGCSPCVPGAGDLESPDGSQMAYCLPPDDMPEDWEGTAILLAKDLYDNGVCPDCGEDIPFDATVGEQCSNCEHVWTEDKGEDA